MTRQLVPHRENIADFRQDPAADKSCTEAAKLSHSTAKSEVDLRRSDINRINLHLTRLTVSPLVVEVSSGTLQILGEQRSRPSSALSSTMPLRITGKELSNLSAGTVMGFVSTLENVELHVAYLGSLSLAGVFRGEGHLIAEFTACLGTHRLEVIPARGFEAAISTSESQAVVIGSNDSQRKIFPLDLNELRLTHMQELRQRQTG